MNKFDEYYEFPDSEEGVKQYHSYNRTNTVVSWTIIFLGVVIIGGIVAMVSYDVTDFLNRADIFLPCK